VRDHEDGFFEMKPRAASRARLVAAFVTFAALSGLHSRAAAAATLFIDNIDPAGKGLNDHTPFTPVGGNTATTLGAARLAVFQQAAALWGAQLTSAVTIKVQSQFVALSCSPTSATLAATGATTVHSDFLVTPPFPPTYDPQVWYPQALANALAGTDLDITSDDIVTEFNSSLGSPGCLPGTTWYLGFDGNPPSGQIDMLTTLLHELAHGLGFQSFEDVTTGSEFNGLPDVYLRNIRQQGANPTALTDMTNTERAAADVSDPNLYWAGPSVQGAGSTYSMGLISGHVRLFAPSTIMLGSTVSHFSTDLFPNELMEPVYTGPNHDLTLTKDLLKDLGWPTVASGPAVPDLPGGWRWVLLAVLALAGAAARRLRRGPSRCVR
jgi:hypothetical protein